jgi:hypothetical protein
LQTFFDMKLPAGCDSWDLLIHQRADLVTAALVQTRALITAAMESRTYVAWSRLFDSATVAHDVETRLRLLHVEAKPEDKKAHRTPLRELVERYEVLYAQFVELYRGRLNSLLGAARVSDEEIDRLTLSWPVRRPLDAQQWTALLQNYKPIAQSKRTVNVLLIG